jgi:hypothetical protein
VLPKVTISNQVLGQSVLVLAINAELRWVLCSSCQHLLLHSLLPLLLW